MTSFFITRTGNHVFDHMRTIYDHTLDKYQIPFQLLLVKYQYSKFRISPSQLLLNIKYHRKSYQISALQISNTITTTIRYQTISTTIEYKILLQLLLNMYKFSNIITITIEYQISAQQISNITRMLGLPRLRQLRVQNLSCEIHPDFQVELKLFFLYYFLI